MVAQEQGYRTQWGGAVDRRETPSVVPTFAVAATAALVGLAALGMLYYLPDLIRYMKIKSM